MNESNEFGDNREITVELTLSAIKDYLVSKGGKSKYSELYNKFRDVIIDSSTGSSMLIVNCF